MQADRVTRAPLGLIFVCLTALAAQVLGGCAEGGQASLGGPGQTERFSLEAYAVPGGSALLLRLDSATGQAWRMRLLAEGRWEPYAEGPEGVPSPGASRAGRYAIVSVQQRRGPATLVRTDSVSGRVWRVGAIGGGNWVPIPNPAKAAPASEVSEDADGPSTT